MKDRALLVLMGVLFTSLGWATWHYLRGEAPWVISTVVLVSVIADNARLRRQLRSKSGHED